MKRILLGDEREPLLVTLETILRHWGYCVSAASDHDNLEGFLRSSTPALLIFSEALLTHRDSLRSAVVRCVERTGAALLVITEQASAYPLPIPCDYITPPLDIFTLFAAVQRHMEAEPRQNLRLAVELPGLLQSGESSQFVQILSLSTHGMFIKTPMQIAVGTQFKIIAPLIGLKRELELAARVIYRVPPSTENGFQGGAGVEFVDPRSSDQNTLQQFLQQCFHDDFHSARARLALGGSCDDLVAGHDKMVLRLVAREIPPQD